MCFRSPVQDRRGQAYARYLAKKGARTAGDGERALADLTEALALGQEVGNYTASCLCELAMLCIEQGRCRQGVRLAGLTLALAPDLYNRLRPDERGDWERLLDRARTDQGATACDAAWEAGQRMPIGAAQAELGGG